MSPVLNSIGIQEPTQTLKRLLAVEDKRKRDIARNASSRHSRFGTTISVTLNPKHKANQTQAQPSVSEDGATVELAPSNDLSGPTPSQAFVLHRQQALKREAGSMLDILRTKRGERFRGAKKVDEVAVANADNLSIEARRVLQELARTFLEACFNRAWLTLPVILSLTDTSFL